MSNGTIGMLLGTTRPWAFIQAVELAARADRKAPPPVYRSRGGLMARVRSASQWAGMPVPAAIATVLLVGCIVGVTVIATMAA